jgi:signal peptidase I
MDVSRRWNKSFWLALLPALLVIVWLNFAPLALGGPVTYVIITGISMEPNFHTGDLVVAHTKPYYQVNDRVVYHHRVMDRFVFHRIVGRSLDRFVLKGENNTWLDSYYPLPEDILGAYWFRLPWVGLVVRWMRQPWMMGSLSGVIGLASVWSVWQERPSRRSRKKKPMKTSPRWLTPKNLNRFSEGAFFTLGLLLFLSLAAAFFAFRAPLERQMPDDAPYRQAGEFFYQASAPAGIYDSEQVQTGDPIFLELTCNMEIGFRYQFFGEDQQEINGTQALTAVVSDVNGWKRTLPLQPVTDFSGDTYTTTASIDLCAVAGMVENLKEETGLMHNEYALTFKVATTVQGSLQGKHLQDSFAPSLAFQFDKISFWLKEPVDPTIDPLHPEQLGMLRSFGIEPNVLSLMQWNIPVKAARVVSGVGFGFSALGLILLGWILSRTKKLGPEARIQLRYGAFLVGVEHLGALDNPVDVASMADLTRLAERYGVMVLHHPQENQHIYVVHAEQAIYRYVLDVPEAIEEEAAEANISTQEPRAVASGVKLAWARGAWARFRERFAKKPADDISSVEENHD